MIQKVVGCTCGAGERAAVHARDCAGATHFVLALTETCDECGCVGTHRGTCSRSMMLGGVALELGVGRIAFGNGERETVLPLAANVWRAPLFVNQDAVRAVRREFVLLARMYRRGAYEQPCTSYALLGAAAAYREAARRLKEVLR